MLLILIATILTVAAAASILFVRHNRRELASVRLIGSQLGAFDASSYRKGFNGRNLTKLRAAYLAEVRHQGSLHGNASLVNDPFDHRPMYSSNDTMAIRVYRSAFESGFYLRKMGTLVRR